MKRPILLGLAIAGVLAGAVGLTGGLQSSTDSQPPITNNECIECSG